MNTSRNWWKEIADEAMVELGTYRTKPDEVTQLQEQALEMVIGRDWFEVLGYRESKTRKRVKRCSNFWNSSFRKYLRDIGIFCWLWQHQYNRYDASSNDPFKICSKCGKKTIGVVGWSPNKEGKTVRSIDWFEEIKINQ